MKIIRQRSNGYQEFGFTLSKENNKYVAICRICNRTLQNTAFIRLRGHRNVCKPPATERSPLCSMYVPSDETFYVPDKSDFLSADGALDSLQQKPNMIVSDSGPVGNEFPNGESNFSQFYNSDQSTQLQAKKKQTNLKKLAVLEVIKKYKHTLFKNSKVDNSEIWMKVLRKAQSLGLASESRNWTYARDCFETWKNRTLSKKEDSDGWNDKLDIVDLAVLQILEKKPELDLSDPTSNCSLEDDQQYTEHPANPVNPTFVPPVQRNDQSYSLSNGISEKNIEKRKLVSTQTTDELYDADVKMKRLQVEVLELEVYKQRLQALKLERELNLPPSRCTAVLFTETELNSSVNYDASGGHFEKASDDGEESMIKIEVGDDD